MPRVQENPTTTPIGGDRRAYPWDYKNEVFWQIHVCNQRASSGDPVQYGEAIANLKGLCIGLFARDTDTLTKFIKNCDQPPITRVPIDPELANDHPKQSYRQVVTKADLRRQFEAILSFLGQAGYIEPEKKVSYVSDPSLEQDG